MRHSSHTNSQPRHHIYHVNMIKTYCDREVAGYAGQVWGSWIFCDLWSVPGAPGLSITFTTLSFFTICCLQFFTVAPGWQVSGRAFVVNAIQSQWIKKQPNPSAASKHWQREEMDSRAAPVPDRCVIESIISHTIITRIHRAQTAKYSLLDPVNNGSQRSSHLSES